MKICSKCKESKPLDAFAKNRSQKDGLAYWCRVCHNAYRKGTYAKVERARVLREKYGITADEYDAMFAAQGGLCLICEQPQEKPLAVDHCHDSGEVRGLLCSNCNVGIGMFKDDPALLANAIKYLQRR